MERFADLLRTFRQRAGLTQRGLAHASHCSEETIASYESGRRRPQRGVVLDLAHGLGLDRDDTNRLLASRGMTLESPSMAAAIARRRTSWPTVQAEVAEYTWPCMVMNEYFEILGWNAAANDVAELDLGRDLTPEGRHQLRMACMDHFRRRMTNWDEVISVMIGLYRFEAFEIAAPGESEPYFNALIAALSRDHPALMPHLFALWSAAEPWPHYNRITWKVEWHPADGTRLQFDATLSGWNYFDASGVQDWFPADAATWRWLEDRRRARLASSTEDAQPEFETDRTGLVTLANAPWNELLRYARERCRMSRRDLAAATATVSESAIYSYEAGRRKPSRETLIEILDGLLADTATANMVLAAAGYEGELGDWARLVGGEPLRRQSGQRHRRKGESRSFEEMQREIERHHWPCHIISGSCEVVCGNSAAATLTGIDFPRLPSGGIERSLLYFITDHQFRDHVPGWREVAANVLPGTLTPYFGPAHDQPGGHYFRQVAEAIRRRDPEVLRDLLAMWRGTTDRKLRTRITFPLRWVTDDGVELEFAMLLAPWNEVDPGWALDWHPANAATWEWFEARQGRDGVRE